jgi:type IV pilus assembly protein PilE
MTSGARDNSLTMQPRKPLQATVLRNRGFTLIEMMITVVIVAILAAVALPSFLDSVRKSRRADAFSAITTVQQAQERWRGNTALYATDAELTLGASAVPPGLGIARTTSSGYYTLALSETSSTGHAVVAEAVAGKSQDQDGACRVLGARVRGGNVTYGAGAAGIDFNAANPDPNRCWAR